MANSFLSFRRKCIHHQETDSIWSTFANCTDYRCNGTIGNCSTFFNPLECIVCRVYFSYGSVSIAIYPQFLPFSVFWNKAFSEWESMAIIWRYRKFQRMIRMIHLFCVCYWNGGYWPVRYMLRYVARSTFLAWSA